VSGLLCFKQNTNFPIQSCDTVECPYGPYGEHQAALAPAEGPAGLQPSWRASLLVTADTSATPLTLHISHCNPFPGPAAQQYATFAQCCQVSFNRAPSVPLRGNGVTSFECYLAPGVQQAPCYFWNTATCVSTSDTTICLSGGAPEAKLRFHRL
jgi:hypothetical protein